MSKRQQLKEQHDRQTKATNLVWGTIVLVLFAVVGYFVWSSLSKPAATAQATSSPASAATVGEAVDVDPDTSHIPDDSDPGTYNSDPPTSGHHYAVPLSAGFYETNTYKYPQGHLVHSLEHGYVIFWYNCKTLNDSQCSDLKAQIKAAMASADNFKVIAYPWTSTDVPVVMTSWGYMLRFPTFDSNLAANFIQQHRNRSPEPGAP